MSGNKELTILLTLWDRVPCTHRWMTYANTVNFPFKVLIADGGSDESVAPVLSNRSNFPNVDYEYLRYPYDATPTDYYTKVLDALKRVETPFVVMADNDDFLFVDGLRRSVDFLKTHPDFSSCRGIIGGVRIKPDAKYGEFSNVYGVDVSFVRQVYPDKSNLEETAMQRVENYFASYRATWYDVFRTEQTTKSFKVLRDLNTRDLILSQHIPMLLGVIAGKVQVEPFLYMLRQLEGPSSVDQTETREKADLFDRMLFDSWSEDFKGFVDTISDEVSRKDGISIEEASHRVRQGYRRLMTAGIVGSLLGSVPEARSVRLTRKIRSYLRPASSLVRKLSRSMRRMEGVQSDYNGRDFIPAANLSKTDNDFKQIYHFLAAPPHSIDVPRQTRLRGRLEYSSN
jgi:glycosyltransferase domain-containing protein